MKQAICKYMTIPIANHPNPTANHAVWFDAVCRSMWCDNGRECGRKCTTRINPVTTKSHRISKGLDLRTTGSCTPPAHWPLQRLLCIWAWNGSWKKRYVLGSQTADISHASVVTCNQTTWKCIQMYSECTSFPCCLRSATKQDMVITGAMPRVPLGDVWSLDFGQISGTGHWVRFEQHVSQAIGFCAVGQTCRPPDCLAAGRAFVTPGFAYCPTPVRSCPTWAGIATGPLCKCQARNEHLSRAITLLGGKQATIYGVLIRVKSCSDRCNNGQMNFLFFRGSLWKNQVLVGRFGSWLWGVHGNFWHWHHYHRHHHHLRVLHHHRLMQGSKVRTCTAATLHLLHCADQAAKSPTIKGWACSRAPQKGSGTDPWKGDIGYPR